MRIATGAEDDDFVHRIMRGRDFSRPLPQQELWIIEPEGGWRAFLRDEFQNCDARRRRLLRYLLRRFPHSTIAFSELEPSLLPGEWMKVGECRWIIPDPAPVNQMVKQFYVGDWTIWHGNETRQEKDVWRTAGQRSLLNSMNEVGCGMFLTAFHDNAEWLLAVA